MGLAIGGVRAPARGPEAHGGRSLLAFEHDRLDEPPRPFVLGRPAHRGGRMVEDRSITILLIDDDEVDVNAIRRSFWRLRIMNPIVVGRNGIEALDILRGHNGHEKIRAPYLVLLDLNMPRMGGIEFLAEMRADPALRRTLVFVMTTSADAEDRRRAYDMNVAGYVLKHQAGKTFLEAIALFESYLRAIEFPD
jgi:CheY-like chemotaxis protein